MLYKMWDAETYPFMRTTKSTFLTYMTLAREPKTQIAGITLLGDMQEMTRKHAPGNWTEVKMYASFMRVGGYLQTIRFPTYSALRFPTYSSQVGRGAPAQV